MGKLKYDVGQTQAAYSTAKASGNTGYAWSKQASSQGIHQSVHPGFGGLRVANDYPDMPALPISFLMDFTGSNINAAHAFYDKLGDFMALLVAQGWVKTARPVIQFLGMDDYRFMPDEWAQITQFEGDGPTTLQWLSKMWLTSNGGGNGKESYEEMFWMLNHQNRLEAWGRKAKGKLFILCDEKIDDTISAAALRHIYGSGNVNSDVKLSAGMSARTALALPTQDVSTKVEVDLLMQNYDVWVMRGAESGYQKDPEYVANWEQYFPKERIIYLLDSAEGPYMAAALIGQQFGVPTTTIQTALAKLDVSKELFSIAVSTLGITPVVRTNPRLHKLP